MPSKHNLRWIILILFVFALLPGVSAQQARPIITPENITQLEPAYFLPDCFHFSPDSQYIAGYTRIYDLSRGIIHFSRSITSRGEVPWEPFRFSPDSQFFVAYDDGVYTTATVEQHFTIAHDSFAFSPDSQLIAVAEEGVYDVLSGEKLFVIGSDPAYLGTELAFSPDSRLLVVEGDAVYDVANRWRLFEINGNGVFSPDGNWLFMRGGVLFDTRTWERPYATGSGGFDPSFSLNNRWLAVPNDGVYEIASGERHFTFGPNPAVFSPDGLLMAVRHVGVYSVGDWQAMLTFVSPEQGEGYIPFFSLDGRLLAVPDDGIYDTQTWEQVLDFAVFFGEIPNDVILSPDATQLAVRNNTSCTIYNLLGDANVQQQFGVASLAGTTNIRQRPSSSSAVIASTELPLAVLAQNADASWYKVDYSEQIGWVAASVVEIVFLPESLPTE